MKVLMTGFNLLIEKIRARTLRRALSTAWPSYGRVFFFLTAFFVASAMLLGTPLSTQAQMEVEVEEGWSLIPEGLGVGDSFRLLFVTSTKRDATATNIANYDTHVQTAAAAGHVDILAYSSQFKVLGSTLNADARDNTDTNPDTDGTGVAIYWLDGDKVADNNNDFYTKDGTGDADQFSAWDS